MAAIAHAPPRDAAAAAALRHRRLGRRRQVDADRAAALRLEVAAGRPGRRRRARPGAADRRPARRARAGHHDRRRVPALRDAAAAVHHRRHARPRAVHAQHGHRRLDGRRGRRAGRRARGPADPEPPPRGDRRPAADPADRAGRQQDGPRRLRRRTSSARICADFRAWAARLDVEEITCIPISALVGDNVVERSAAMDWYRGPTLLAVPRDRAGRRPALADGPLRLPGPVRDPRRRAARLRRPARGRHGARGRRGRRAAGRA